MVEGKNLTLSRIIERMKLNKTEVNDETLIARATFISNFLRRIPYLKLLQARKEIHLFILDLLNFIVYSA